MMNLKKLPNAIQFALFVGAASMVSGAAFAQDQEEDASQEESQDEATTLDRIQVTGSRLKRADIEGALPVIVIDREQIDASGDVSVADVLRDSTFASFGNFRPQSGSSAQSLATANLRGLGGRRTLVLINGQRAPTAPTAAASGSNINAIPLAAVERIEILSSGASAIYGSDAIGGVVNVILRKDFNGVEIRYGIQQTAVKGGDQEEASAVFGTAGERGQLIGGVGYTNRDLVLVRDQIGYTPGASTFGNNYYDWGLNDPNPSIKAVPGAACDGPGFYPTPSNGRCAYDFNLVAANQASLSNKSLFLLGDYQINDDWSVYANATVTKVHSFGRYAPAPGVFTVSDGTPQDINFDVMLRDDPAYTGNQQDAIDAGLTDGLPTYFFHRFAAAGNRDNNVNEVSTDFLLGFQGRLFDSLDVDFGVRRTHYESRNRGSGYVVAPLAKVAAENGTYDVANPFAASADTLNGFTATTSRVSVWDSDEIFGLVNFDLFEMGGGISNAVVGAEHRELTFVDNYDSLSSAKTPDGLPVLIGSAGASSAGERSVSSIYAEWLFPIVSTFDVTVAGRYDKYSDYGSDFSPKVSLRWQPLDNLTLRGSYGNGFAAPPLNFLSAKPAFSAAPVADPQTCVARGLPADCSGEQVDTIFIANPNLSSEQSTQYGLGVVWDPTDWLDISVDYYNIEIEDVVSQVSAQDIVNSDLDPATFGPIPPGFSIERRPGTGAIKEIIAGYTNRGLLETDGIDLRANTEFDFGDMGTLQNRLIVAYTLSYDETTLGNTTEFIGLVGQPDYRAQLQNVWTTGDWTFTYGVNFISSQYNDEDRNVGGYATNDLQVAWEAPWNAQVVVGATNVGDRYPELVTFDGRAWNYGLYDAYGRTTYFRYTQRF